MEIDALVTYIRSLEATAPSVANPRGTQQGGGEPPWLRGIPGEGHMELSWLQNRTTGVRLALRTPEGMPVWQE